MGDAEEGREDREDIVRRRRRERDPKKELGWIDAGERREDRAKREEKTLTGKEEGKKDQYKEPL